jgi:hypothetical protein
VDRNEAGITGAGTWVRLGLMGLDGEMFLCLRENTTIDQSGDPTRVDAKHTHPTAVICTLEMRDARRDAGNDGGGDETDTGVGFGGGEVCSRRSLEGPSREGETWRGRGAT